MEKIIMKIKVNKKNENKINKLIAEIEGRARSRRKEYCNLEKMIRDCEAQFERYQLPKNLWQGNKVWEYEGKGISTRSYGNYPYESTRVTIERGSKDWFLINVERVTLYPNNPSRTATDLTQPAKEYLMENVVRVVTEIY